MTKIKFKNYENVTPEKIRKAIEVLNTGGTKKAACDALGIKYNVTRLQKIVEFTRKEEIEKTLRAKKARTAVDKDEAIGIIKEYLETASIDAVAKMYFRTPYTIAKVLDDYGAKLHSAKTDYFNPGMLPEICMADKFVPGEYVWSSRHNMLAVIRKEWAPGVYAIRVLGKHEKDAFQETADLGSLQHLVELGIDFKKIRIHEHERKDEDE
jgi:hypothetical protein